MNVRNDPRSLVKEALDNLPSGVCFFADNGLLVLCNKTMYRLAFEISGKDPQTLSELEEALHSNPENPAVSREGNVFLLPDGTAWNFSLEKIEDDRGRHYTQVIAGDVSELIKGSKELAANIERLKETQANIRSMRKNLVAITKENEILSLKMKVHDELGAGLLSIRRYYLGTGAGSKQELIDHWKSTVGMLKYESGLEEEKDPIADLMKSARSIGVEIVKNGEMPQDTTAARLIVRAVRQCLTNAVKHADGNTIFVNLKEEGDTVTAVITNDGRAPTEEIEEGSGLSSLRKRIEKAGGVMRIQSLPEFAMYVTVPVTIRNKEEEFE